MVSRQPKVSAYKGYRLAKTNTEKLNHSRGKSLTISQGYGFK